MLELPGLASGESAPVEPRVPNTAARSVESQASIIQAASDGTGLGGAPALPAGALRVDVTAAGDGASARIRVDRPGTLRLYLWDGEAVVGALDTQEVSVGRKTYTVPVTGTVADGAKLQLAVSFETDGGTAAAQAVVG